MGNALFTWVGITDIRAQAEESEVGPGPIAQAVTSRSFDEIHLMSDFPQSETDTFVEWLRTRTGPAAEIVIHSAPLSQPNSFGEIYEHGAQALEDWQARRGSEADLVFHLSPGTPAMAAVWVILAKTRFPAELVESSRGYGVRTASVPFDISADYLPDLLRKPDDELTRLTDGLPPAVAEFEAIIHRSEPMRRVVARARRVAPRTLPVLITGETGTGKELLARAIHHGSPRSEGPFVPVNCGAIPTELVDSELFGHKKGAFTGALTDRVGYLEASSGGTLFLDEIGELPLASQVKLLRALQEKEVMRIGENTSRPIDIRVISATNRNLIEDVAAGRFRADLFHRVAVLVLKLPSLRDRAGDLGFLIDHFLEIINREAVGQPGYVEKSLSAGARNILLNHAWPGNVRELLNTLQRAAVWSIGAVIDDADIEDSLLPLESKAHDTILEHNVAEGIDLEDLMAQVARHYLTAALEHTHGNKTQASKLVGLASYQTMTNWLKRYGVKHAT